MPACSICARRIRTAVDAMLLAGKSERSVAAALGIHKSTVHRHRNCLARELERLERRREVRQQLRVVYGRYDRESGKFLVNAESSALEAFRIASEELTKSVLLTDRDREVALLVATKIAEKLGFRDDDDNQEDHGGNELAETAFPTEADDHSEAGDGTYAQSAERELDSDATSAATRATQSERDFYSDSDDPA